METEVFSVLYRYSNINRGFYHTGNKQKHEKPVPFMLVEFNDYILVTGAGSRHDGEHNIRRERELSRCCWFSTRHHHHHHHHHPFSPIFSLGLPVTYCIVFYIFCLHVLCKNPRRGVGASCRALEKYWPCFLTSSLALCEECCRRSCITLNRVNLSVYITI